eukprot:Gb_05319 [translate_table: standard]
MGMVHLSSSIPVLFTTKLMFWSVGRDRLYLYRFCSPHKATVLPFKALNNRTTICKFSSDNFETEKSSQKRLQLFDSLNTKQKGQVSLYVDALLEWNQRMNLTAVTERYAVMERHIEDSLMLLPVIENAYSKHCSGPTTVELKVVDVGSGAGLPGIILAIARPDWQVTLLESIQKRCFFLEHVVEVSGLSNVQVVRARAEWT